MRRRGSETRIPSRFDLPIPAHRGDASLFAGDLLSGMTEMNVARSRICSACRESRPFHSWSTSTDALDGTPRGHADRRAAPHPSRGTARLLSPRHPTDTRTTDTPHDRYSPLLSCPDLGYNWSFNETVAWPRCNRSVRSEAVRGAA